MTMKRKSGRGVGSKAKQEGDQLASFFAKNTNPESATDISPDTAPDSESETNTVTGTGVGTDTGTGTNTEAQPDPVMESNALPDIDKEADTDMDTVTETQSDLYVELFPKNEKELLERKVFYLTQKQAAIIEDQAERTGRSQSEILRFILEKFLEDPQ